MGCLIVVSCAREVKEDADGLPKTELAAVHYSIYNSSILGVYVHLHARGINRWGYWVTLHPPVPLHCRAYLARLYC